MMGDLLLESAKNSGEPEVSILIIDDDENITRTFSRILQKSGYRTDTAQSGAEAVQKSGSKAYDVALIDICLPDMNGLELLHRLTDPEGRMIKIVITGFPTMADMSVHPDAFLLKPVKPQELLLVISQKIGQP
jgi:CheY-like chemotaxis protein